MLNILIVEDQAAALKRCALLIQEILPQSKLFYAKNGHFALDIMRRIKIDAGFIDKELPDIDGFELVAKIRQDEAYATMPIIFVTGSREDSFDLRKKYRHYEYICKPYTKADFRQIAGPFLKGINTSKDLILGQEKENERVITFNSINGIYTVKLSEILYAETNDNVQRLYTESAGYFELPVDLSTLIEWVNSASFVKCHKSCAVNLSKIVSIHPFSRKAWDLHLNEEGTIRCPLSLRYKRELQKICASDVFSF